MTEGFLSPREVLLNDLVDSIRAAEGWKARWNGRSTARRVKHYLVHAARTVPRFRGIGEKRIVASREPLRLFPLSTREEMRDRAAVIAADVSHTELHWVATSGTSGIPLDIARDSISNYYFLHETFAVIASRVPELARAIGQGRTTAIIVNDNPDRLASLWFNPAIRGYVERRLLGRGDAADKALLAFLRRERIPLLTARPRSLRRIAELNESGRGAPIRPGAIFTSGDTLHPDDRAALEAHFRCRVYNGYSCQETGLAASECRYRNGLHATAGVMIEVYTGDGVVRPSGSGDLVITNLENWAMPFVRYRTGDQGLVERRRCRCGFEGTTLTELAGRESTYFFHVSARVVNPSVLNPLFERLPVRQFQVTQTDSAAFVVQYVAHTGAIAATIHAAITREFSERFGGAAVRIEPVDAIGKAGQKVQRYVCTLRKTT